MDNYNKELSVERGYLNQTIFQIIKQLENEINREQNEKVDIISSRKEMWENAAPSSDDIDSLLEASQYKQSLNVQLSNYLMTDKKIRRLKSMKDTPYFARFDFIESREDREKIYIGLSTLVDEDNYDIYVYDWRSPISSIFYRFELGDVYYEAPAGKIYGRVLLKRQYEIKDSKLQYFFDSSIQITDELLKRLLSENTSPKMKSIVETIQRDQDIIIRDMENDLLIVQGVAGSGKTSVALHRVAYLMYQGLSSNLSAHNIIIISPNSFFGNYISNVLPELGEENIKTLIFEDFFEDVFYKQYAPIQTRNQLLENLITCDDFKKYELMKSSIKFKSSKVFIEILKGLIKYYERKVIEFTDIYYNNQYIFTNQELKSILLKNTSSKPLIPRLKDLEKLILDKIRLVRKERVLKLEKFVQNYSQHAFQVKEMARLISIYESGILYKKIKRFIDIDYLEAYSMLFFNENLFYQLARGLELPENIKDIILYTKDNLNSSSLMYEDALSLLFLQTQMDRYNGYADIKQIVIDEAQDYYPIHFEILKSLFPNARYTILGDINQTIEKPEDISFYKDIQNILQKKKSTVVSMNKSFRCTNEIISFSSQFIDGGNIVESFNRKGQPPKVLGAGSQESLENFIIEEVLECNKQGYDSIGILCKSRKEAKYLYDSLNKKIELKLLNENSNDEIKGVFIIPIYMAKGLEFDAVIVSGLDDENYKTEDDKKLLYIACTRALHRLAVFYTGTKSRLLKGE